MTYTPDRGDVVWLDFNPEAGHEQAGRRPALVISPISYNRKTGLAIMVPITSRVKGYPFEVTLPDELSLKGVALSDQVKNLDWRVRKVELIGKAPDPVVKKVVQKVGILVGC